MDQYEDLQKFREKTQMKSIHFVDFTKQNKQIDHSQWSIVQQLSNSGTPLVNNLSSEQKSPATHSFLMNKTPDTVHLAPLTTGSILTTSATALLKDVDMQLKRPETFQIQEIKQSESPIMPQTEHHEKLQKAPTNMSPQADFSHLFTSPVKESPVIETEAPLQSLLKRIATCR